RSACSRQPIFVASSAVVSQSRSLLFCFSDASAFGCDFDAFCGGIHKTLDQASLSVSSRRLPPPRLDTLLRGWWIRSSLQSRSSVICLHPVCARWQACTKIRSERCGPLRRGGRFFLAFWGFRGRSPLGRAYLRRRRA